MAKIVLAKASSLIPHPPAGRSTCVEQPAIESFSPFSGFLDVRNVGDGERGRGGVECVGVSGMTMIGGAREWGIWTARQIA